MAQQLFGDLGIRYEKGMLEGLDIQGPFDLIVLMDVYEHVEAGERASLHRELDGLLAPRGSIFVSVPTPDYQRHLRASQPDRLQPVDEDVSTTDLEIFAEACNATLVIYRKVSVWRHLDYAHAFLRRVPEAGALKLPPRSLRQRLGTRALGMIPPRRWQRRRRERLVVDRLGVDWLEAARRS